jgi:hypothetical protein
MIQGRHRAQLKKLRDAAYFFQLDHLRNPSIRRPGPLQASEGVTVRRRCAAREHPSAPREAFERSREPEPGSGALQLTAALLLEFFRRRE